MAFARLSRSLSLTIEQKEHRCLLPSRNLRMNRRLTLPCLSLCAAVLLGVAFPSVRAAEELNQEPVKMAPFRVEGSYLEVRFAARFRYHLPGKGLKALVFVRVPKSWMKQGIQVGDWLVGVDGAPVEGMGLVAFVKMIEGKTGTPMLFEVQAKDSHEIRKVEVLFSKGSGELAIQYP